jgi:hypothetical protein
MLFKYVVVAAALAVPAFAGSVKVPASKKPKSTVYTKTTVTSTCESESVLPEPTTTIIVCEECEGGYTTSICYPDVTVTVTACNTCLEPTSTECTTAATISPVPVVPSSSICTTTTAATTANVWVSGAERNGVAFAGVVGVAALAALLM